MQIWAESGKSALPICNYSQILYQFLTFTQNLKRSQVHAKGRFFCYSRRNPSFFNIQCQGSKAPYYDTHGLFASVLPQSYNLSIKAS